MLTDSSTTTTNIRQAGRDFPDVESWDVPLYFEDGKSQDCDGYRVDVALDTDTGAWEVMPYIDYGRTYSNPEVERIIEVLRQSVNLTNELNAL